MIQRRPSKEEVLTTYRRSAILDSAREVFGDCGFERATIDRIARDAGVAKGTVYLYYASKQSIYEDALNHGLTELDGLVRARLEAAPTLRDAIAAFIRTRVEYFLERRGFFRMYVAAVASQLTETHPCPAEFKAMNDRQTRRLQAVVADALGKGHIRRVDPSAVTRVIFDVTRGLAARRLMSAHEPDLDGEIDLLVSLIWQGIGKAGAETPAPARPVRKTRAKGKGAR